MAMSVQAVHSGDEHASKRQKLCNWDALSNASNSSHGSDTVIMDVQPISGTPRVHTHCASMPPRSIRIMAGFALRPAEMPMFAGARAFFEEEVSRFDTMKEILGGRISLRCLEWVAHNLDKFDSADKPGALDLFNSFRRCSAVFRKQYFDFFQRDGRTRGITIVCGREVRKTSLAQLTCLKWCICSGFWSFVCRHVVYLSTQYEKHTRPRSGRRPSNPHKNSK